ncbi:MAG: T9SS type A sorting domain-containing protein [Saprospiraceae bacterium]|nr:T9SS type A sorting domain-containing protein [Saprospiraceae bacterium]
MKHLLLILTLSVFFQDRSICSVLHVGASYQYHALTEATAIAKPGDSIICHDLIMQGGMSVSNLSGTSERWIYILAESGKTITIQGGTNSIQFSDCAYLHIEGFTIQGQTGNGMNIDDAGSFDSPTHHLRIVGCTFQNINATGNNDLLKLSGLDFFEIYSCLFFNGAAGGSGIDMVGCHHGMIFENVFKNLGSNSIQCKGGSSDIQILRNQFENGGARALNLGGSTGLSFFRPQNATTEAENIQVIANVFQGSEASIAFVGCRNVEVSNNTILFPKKWVIRILQETVDVTRFLPCGANSFYNNIVVLDNAVSVEANIGPNTEEETFMFNKNLWYKTTNQNWQGPDLPGTVSGQIIDNPKILPGSLFILESTSPAISAGVTYNLPVKDILGSYFNSPPTIGAYEAVPLITQVDDIETKVDIFPNPFDDEIQVYFNDNSFKTISMMDVNGKLIHYFETFDQSMSIFCNELLPGVYFMKISNGREQMTRVLVKR